MARTRKNLPRNLKRIEQHLQDMARWGDSDSPWSQRYIKRLRSGNAHTYSVHMPFPDGAKGYDDGTSVGTSGRKKAKRAAAKIMRRRGRKAISESVDT